MDDKKIILFWQMKYLEAYKELVNANKGIRRLKNKLKQPREIPSEIGICPYCNNSVKGKIKKNECCMTTFCKTCDTFLLEDEVDWRKDSHVKKKD